MITTSKRFTIGPILLSLIAASVVNSGCSRGKDESPDPKPTLAVPGSAAASKSKGSEVPRHDQTFKEATIADLPEDQLLLEVTKTKKSVGKLYEAVIKEWEKATFVSGDGKKLAYTATITTDLGVVTFELWPEVAPNHVRNFIALARAGYYDGLAFDRAIKREEGDGKFFECLEGGCPAGTGDSTYGSIGYWLRPEFNPTVTHDVGTIGAWHGAEVESAACKFYINLSKAEWMDGQFTLFGKVTKGLDVLRAIHAKPVAKDGQQDRPVEPVVMQSVVITSAVRE